MPHPQSGVLPKTILAKSHEKSSVPMSQTVVVIMAIGVALPFTPLGRYLGFTALPRLYWPFVVVTLFCYVLLAQAVRTWLLRRR